MSIYFEKARELGELILASEESLNLADATENYKKTPQAVQMLEAYKAYQDSVQEGIKNNTVTQEDVREASEKLTEMATKLKQDPVIGALIFAENEFNSFVNQIMNVLKLTITGQPVEGGGCASCPGGCGDDAGCSGCSQ